MESCKVCVPTAKCPYAGVIRRKAAGEGKWEEVHQGKANNKAASAMAPRQDSEPTFTGGHKRQRQLPTRKDQLKLGYLVTVMTVFCHLDTNLDISKNKES